MDIDNVENIENIAEPKTTRKSISIETALEIFEKIKEQTKKECYKVVLSSPSPEITDNKIGGKPYLPIGEEYPVNKDGEPMALLLQISLDDIDLPNFNKKGVLEIFVNRNINKPLEYAIRCFDIGQEYQKADSLPDVDTKNFILDGEYKISVKKSFCYMPSTDYRWDNITRRIIKDTCDINVETLIDLSMFADDFDFTELFCENYSPINGALFTIGGYADFTQDDPRYGKLKDVESDCLFKLDSLTDERIFHIGDMGIICGMISEKDLVNGDYHQAIVDWTCY